MKTLNVPTLKSQVHMLPFYVLMIIYSVIIAKRIIRHNHDRLGIRSDPYNASSTTDPPDLHSYGKWITSQPHLSDSGMVRKIKESGYYSGWGIPITGIEDVQSVFRQRNVLFIGDSYLQNIMIELTDLYFGNVENTSTSNPVKINGTKLKLHPSRSNYLLDALNSLDLHNVSLHYMGKYSDTCGIPRHGGYYISKLSQILNAVRHSDCFIKWLRQFDVIVCDVYVHEWVLPSLVFPREMYPTKLDECLQLLPPDIKKKLIWISPKSYKNTNTPLKYLKRQSPPTSLVTETLRVLKHNHVRHVDFYTPTLACTWKNCTVEDHHHSRFVARSVAMKLIEMMHNES
mgnify:CR=1 FL=1